MQRIKLTNKQCINKKKVLYFFFCFKMRHTYKQYHEIFSNDDQILCLNAYVYKYVFILALPLDSYRQKLNLYIAHRRWKAIILIKLMREFALKVWLDLNMEYGYEYVDNYITSPGGIDGMYFNKRLYGLYIYTAFYNKVLKGYRPNVSFIIETKKEFNLPGNNVCWVPSI